MFASRIIWQCFVNYICYIPSKEITWIFIFKKNTNLTNERLIMNWEWCGSSFGLFFGAMLACAWAGWVKPITNRNYWYKCIAIHYFLWSICVPAYQQQFRFCIKLLGSAKLIFNIGILKLTPRSKVLLENLTVIQLVKKFPAFCGTHRFITMFTKAHHWTLFWAKWVHPHPNALFL